MTRVTVVMPVLNEERSVRDAVRSVLDQTFADLELLVVDGDSTDGTAAAVSALAAAEPRVRLVRNPARTIPSALNLALGQARGDFVARVDGHASVNDTYLERAVATLDADPQVAAVGGRRIGVARTASGAAVATALSSRFGVGDSINHYALQAQDTDHASFGVFRVAVVRGIGGWDEGLLVNEDVDLDHRILGRGYRIRFDPDMCIYWHVRESVPDLARQYRRYGRGKAAMVRKNGRGAVRIRHLAPPALVVALALAALAVIPGWWPVTVLLAGPYVLAIGAATAITVRTAEPVAEPPRRGGQPVGTVLTRSAGARSGDFPADAAAAGPGRRTGVLRLAGSFLAMHLGWGLGFLEGLVLHRPPATASARVPGRSRRAGPVVPGASSADPPRSSSAPNAQASGAPPGADGR